MRSRQSTESGLRSMTVVTSGFSFRTNQLSSPRSSSPRSTPACCANRRVSCVGGQPVPASRLEEDQRDLEGDPRIDLDELARLLRHLDAEVADLNDRRAGRGELVVLKTNVEREGGRLGDPADLEVARDLK